MKNLQRLLFASLLGCFLPVLSYAQGIFIPPRVVTGVINGITRPIAGATVTVCAANSPGTPCSPALANTVFKDSGLTVPLSNPFTTDANGNYPQAALAGGVYTITESAPGFVGFSYQATVSCAPGAGCTITGAFTAATANGLVHVGGNVSATDIGTQINNAYAAFPSSGGTIVVDPPPSGSCYSFSTPIVATTAGKYLLLQGGGSGGATGVSTMGGTCLNYTPTTATSAITLDYVPNTQSALSAQHGVQNIILINNLCMTTGGCGSSAIGIQTGTTNSGTYEASFINVSILGFSIGYNEQNTRSVDVNFFNPQFFFNATGIVVGSPTGIILYGGTIAGNGKILSNTVGNFPEIEFHATQMFGNITSPNFDFTANTNPALGAAQFECFQCHFETGNFPLLFIDGDVDITIVGGLMEFTTAAQTQATMVSAKGNKVYMDAIQYGCAGTCTQIISAAGSLVRGYIGGFIVSGTHFTNVVTGAHAANITNHVLPGNTNNASTAWTHEMALQGPNGAAGSPSYSFTGFTTSGLYDAGNPHISNGGTDEAGFGDGTTGVQIPSTGCFSIATTATLGSLDVALCRLFPSVLSIGQTNGTTTGYIKTAQSLQVTGSNFTTSSASLVAVTGLTFTAPANAATHWAFRCDLIYSQATAAAANLWGIITSGTAPTNLQVGAEIYTNNTGTQVDNNALITTAASTTVATATPSAFGAIGTNADMFNAHIFGELDAPSNASPTVVAVAVATGNASDALTIYRSGCAWY